IPAFGLSRQAARDGGDDGDLRRYRRGGGTARLEPGPVVRPLAQRRPGQAAAAGAGLPRQPAAKRAGDDRAPEPGSGRGLAREGSRPHFPFCRAHSGGRAHRLGRHLRSCRSAPLARTDDADGFIRDRLGVSPPPVRCKACRNEHCCKAVGLEQTTGGRLGGMATAQRQGKAKSGGTATAERKLIRGLCDRLAHSLLPGEPPLTREKLDEAADFLLEAAAKRAEGEAALLVRSATGERRVTRIAIINRDMPFLVDSIAATIAAQNLAIDLLLHPILPVKRDTEGRLSDLANESDASAILESMIYLETGRVDAKERRILERELALTLADVRVAVGDWHKMRALMAADADRLSDPEGAELLRWFEGGMLTLLGHLTHARSGKQAQRLGICRKSARELVAAETYERAFAWFEKNGTEAPLMVKANRLSRVHRRVPLDLIIVPVVEDGQVAALSIHAGIWTSAALAAPPQDVP